MTDRYYSESPLLGETALLAGPEAHHLIHVMRAKPGSRVVLFDGSGAEFPARVERVDRGEVELALLSRDEIDRELPLELTLAVALPKGDRQKWLVQKAVELGVGRIVPLRTAHSVSQPGAQAVARLRRAVIEASKQCGRNRLMEIAGPQSWTDLVAGTPAVPCRILAHPGCRADAAQPSTRANPLTGAQLPDTVVLAVGPEGGFTAEEVALATAAGWQTLHLGPRTLRIETAAVLLASMVVARTLPA